MPENDIFYFHSDHLGSSSYITTINGSISQHVEYIVFGEVLFEEHSSSFKTPYLYNGKELDRETNLSYYGARYLDMKTSLWLNVDPFAESGSDVGAYVYCFNNPINLMDPDGNWPDFPSWKDFKKTASQEYNKAKSYASEKYNESKNYASAKYKETKTTVSKTYKETKAYVDKKVVETKKKLVEIAKKPLFSITQTTKEVTGSIGIDTGILGDKYSYEQSISKTIGKANGLINIDITTDLNGSFDSVTLSSPTGGSTSLSSTGMITAGQSFGDSELHLGIGPGVGLEEINMGSTKTNSSGTVGGDVNMRPGLGTVAAAAVVVTAPVWAPVVAPVAAPVAAGLALPILLQIE